MAVLYEAEDRKTLQAVARKGNWRVLEALDRDSAFAMAKESCVPVVLLDRGSPGSNWRQAIQQVASAGHLPCVLLASSVLDAYLWEEVIHCGGFDTIRKPIREPELLHTLEFALAHWRSGWRHRRRSQLA